VYSQTERPNFSGS